MIPVLTVVHRAAPGGTTLEYKIKADQLDDVAGMYCIMVSGVLCWLIYGFMLGAMPIILANLISLALSAFILAMKLIYK